jgi:hypothetical protein
LSEFRTSIDIANRACQHLGQTRIGSAGFNEVSKQAREIGAAYDVLRRAELERNPWRFAIRLAVLRAIDTDTMLLAPALWTAETTYFAGSLVSYDDLIWISRIPDNLNFEPGSTTGWDLYFGPLTAALYDSTLTYEAGEIVYSAAGDGTNRVYLSLQGSNEDNPATATAWAATVTYRKNDVVTYSAVTYMSLIDLNTNNTPSAAPQLWDAATSYSIGNQVGATDGVIYTSVTNANLNNDPTADAGTNWTNTGVLNPWTRVFVGGAGSMKWRQIGGAEFPSGVALTTIDLLYPLGSGPSSQASSRNVFHLPSGYLKQAPQDPKAGSASWLGAPTNRQYDDWDFQDAYLVSSDIDPIVFRFVADVASVPQMNSMFCEGLGARLALATCETITQSREKIGTIGQVYEKFMRDARLQNFIETGPVEPPMDDWLAVRS